MKNQALIILSLLSSPIAHAADLVPTQFKAIETDLARSELKLQNAYSYRFGLGFSEGHRYLLNPSSSDVEDSSSIRRDINFSLMLPYSIETGIALYDTQQAAANGLVVEHKKQHLGGALWARYHLIQNEMINSSVILQYEAGTADRNSFHQASQDKTSFALHLDASPLAYTQAGIFVGASSRKDEAFRGTRLGNEVLYGTRLSFGLDSIKIFGEAQFRTIPVKLEDGTSSDKASKQYEAGLSLKYNDIAFQAATYIPTKERYYGVPERGVHIGVQMIFGKGSAAAKPVILEEKSSYTPKPIDDLNALKSDVKDEGLGQIPIVSDDIKSTNDDVKAAETLTLPGADEFQKWEAAQATEKKQPESAAEKAEREYRAQIVQEKKMEALKVKKDAADRAAEEARLRKEYEMDDKVSKEAQAEIEKELNQYTLPTNEDVSWNGLNK